MAAHALLSASGASRWLNCPPSARLEEKMPDSQSDYAAEGTLAHTLGELQLKLWLKEIGKKAYGKELSLIKQQDFYCEDMLEEVEKYTNYVAERMAVAKACTKDALIYLEQKLDFSSYVPEGFGTGDCIIIADGTMEVIDLKYGKGVQVFAEDNPQMMLYALGAYEEYGFIYDFDTVRMTIAQPRLDHFDSWEISVQALLEWANGELREKANLAWAGEGEQQAGTWCRFCKVKATCKARAEAVLAVEEQYKLQDPRLLNETEIAEILAKAEEIQAWAKDVQDFALEQALEGTKYEGWKLIEGRSNRKYTDEESVAKELEKQGYGENDIFNKKVKGITELEKFLGKKLFEAVLKGYIHKPAGKPSLVVASDKRPELNSAESDFDFK